MLFMTLFRDAAVYIENAKYVSILFSTFNQVYLIVLSAYVTCIVAVSESLIC